MVDEDKKRIACWWRDAGGLWWVSVGSVGVDASLNLPSEWLVRREPKPSTSAVLPLKS